MDPKISTSDRTHAQNRNPKDTDQTGHSVGQDASAHGDSRVTTATLVHTLRSEVAARSRPVLNPDGLGLVLHLCAVLVQGLEPETLGGERGVGPSSLEIIEQRCSPESLGHGCAGAGLCCIEPHHSLPASNLQASPHPSAGVILRLIE